MEAVMMVLAVLGIGVAGGVVIGSIPFFFNLFSREERNAPRDIIKLDW